MSVQGDGIAPHQIVVCAKGLPVCCLFFLDVYKRQVAKASAGAINYTPVAKVTNISAVIEELKEKGLWFVCADMDGTVMYDMDLRGPIGLVIGNEGEGVSRLVKEKCDFTAVSYTHLLNH